MYQEYASTTKVEIGPLSGETQLSAGVDYYKLTMSQLQYERYSEAQVTFTFKNRSNVRLADYIDTPLLQERFDRTRERGWSEDELDYFGSLRDGNGQPLCHAGYLQFLRTRELPAVEIGHDAQRDDLTITATGSWPLVTFWETVVMSEVNEAYFEGLVRAKGLNIEDIYQEGEWRLSEKIAFLQAHPELQLADFGTRRRFSLRWHKHVLQRLQAKCPQNLLGTSNIGLALELGLHPIGTFAHELPMVYAGIADARGEDIRASHGHMLDDWYSRYGGDLAIALSDTFGSEFFFDSLTTTQADGFIGTRQDSGDPVTYGEDAISFYESKGIDPLAKTIVFSDNLNVYKAKELVDHFAGRIGLIFFGIGTNLTHDVGLPAPNNVMKATRVTLPDGASAELVKLSDDEGKNTGSAVKVAQYQTTFGINID